jgi:hypothetical protein
MRSRRGALVLWLAGTLACVAMVATGVTACPDKPPPSPPPWTTSDGRVDMSKVPARIGVAGPDGNPLLDAQGRPVTISKDELFAPPSSPPDGPPPVRNPRCRVTRDWMGRPAEVCNDVDHRPKPSP